MSYIIKYFNNTKLPEHHKNTKFIKFEAYKNNGKFEGFCIIDCFKVFYSYEEVYFIDNKKMVFINYIGLIRYMKKEFI